MANVLIRLLQIASILFIARALLSWIRIGADSPFAGIVDVIYRITEPVLAPIRKVLPQLGGIDLSVLIVILVINYLLVPIVASGLG